MNSSYSAYAKQRAARSPVFTDTVAAFWVGGCICAFAQALLAGYSAIVSDEETAKALVPVTLIALTALLTGIDCFDRIAKYAGAGTLVPITGFANAVVSCAIDNKDEGWVLGMGAKIFTIAGPVILYGTLASVAYGIIYLLTGWSGLAA